MGMITLCEFSFYSDYSISRDFAGAMTKVPLVSFAELHRMIFNKVIGGWSTTKIGKTDLKTKFSKFLVVLCFFRHYLGKMWQI